MNEAKEAEMRDAMRSQFQQNISSIVCSSRIWWYDVSEVIIVSNENKRGILCSLHDSFLIMNIITCKVQRENIQIIDNIYYYIWQSVGLTRQTYKHYLDIGFHVKSKDSNRRKPQIYPFFLWIVSVRTWTRCNRCIIKFM